MLLTSYTKIKNSSRIACGMYDKPTGLIASPPPIDYYLAKKAQATDTNWALLNSSQPPHKMAAAVNKAHLQHSLTMVNE